MPLPRSIQAQLEQANAVLAQANAPQDTPAEPPPQAQVAADPPEPAPQPAEPQAAQEPPAPQPPQPQNDVWEHKYKTLQGLFNREVPTLQNQVKDLKAQLEMAVAKLNEAAEAKKPSEPTQPVADPRDVENFGSDLVEMVQRTAERLFGRVAGDVQARAANLEQRLAQLEQALHGTTQTVAMTAEQSFFDRLTKLVPDWEQTNANQAFLAWLVEVDPVYGQPRQAALEAAQRALNADHAAAVFKAFTATQPAAPKASAVDKQVSPKGAASAAPPAPTSKPILTQQQIVDYYNAKRRGEYRGQEAEVARIEQMINQAIAEGRVQ